MRALRRRKLTTSKLALEIALKRRDVRENGIMIAIITIMLFLRGATVTPSRPGSYLIRAFKRKCV